VTERSFVMGKIPRGKEDQDRSTTSLSSDPRTPIGPRLPSYDASIAVL
jgi:hypothetical protein